MTVAATEPRRIQTPELSALTSFNHEFAAKSDLSRYESIRSEQRVTSLEASYLNLLQMGSYIPTRIALLLKNNLHDTAFTAHMVRSALYELKQNAKIGDTCFHFLHKKLNNGDFVGVFKYLYILMLYDHIAEAHDTQVADQTLHFESSASYSDKLVRSPPHVAAREELNLQVQSRIEFLKTFLTKIASRTDCPQAAREQVFAAARALDNRDFNQFRVEFMHFLDKMEAAPPLEKICWKELQTNLAPFQERAFFDQAFLCLKTENYYKNCLARVTALRQSLERTNSADLLTLSEKSKKAYNGCIYLLSDSQNMVAYSTTRFAALTGKMRTEWQAINSVFNRTGQQHLHRLCACQVQTPPDQNQLATWPFNAPTLIDDLKPVQQPTPQELQQREISQVQFQENQKKTVAVIGCNWGGGHREVSRGIANNLSSRGFHTITVDLPEVLISQDFIRNVFITRWFGKNWSTGALFEGLLKEKAFAFINFFRWAKAKLFSALGYSDEELKLVLEHLLKLNPDSVITTYSANNESIIQACKILGIPCIHVATDIDTSVETRLAPPEYNHFKMAIPFDAPETINPILNTTTPEQRFVSGPPVRHPFTIQRTADDIRRFKEKWGIDTNKKVVVISNGKNGSFSPYAEILAKKYANADPATIPIHVVVICGKSHTAFKHHLEQNVLPHTKLPMTIDLFYNEEKMEELMAMASYGGALVGKAGGSTIFEACVKGTRVLVDNVDSGWLSEGFHHFMVNIWEWLLRMFGFEKQLPWEKVNRDFAKKQGIAQSFKEEQEFLPKLEQMLQNDNYPVPLNIEVKNIEEEIPHMLQQMVAEAQRDLEIYSAREVHRKC